MSDIDGVVTAMMTAALRKASHPYAYLADLAERLTRIGGMERLPEGARRRMEAGEAHAAVTAVSRMMRRLGLTPSTICAAANVASEAKGYYSYTLTAAEMDDAGNLLAPLATTRRVRKSIGPFVRMVREVARATGTDEADLLQELGAEIAGYLAPFDVAEPDPYEDLVGDLGSLAPFFARPRKGSDDEPVDLREYFSGAIREGVSYIPRRNAMLDVSDDETPDNGFWQAPTVPLFVRTVASGIVLCTGYENGDGGRARHVPLGAMNVDVIEVISLGLVLSGKGLKAVFFADPWTVTYGKPGEASGHPWLNNPTAFVPGTPFSGGLRVMEGDGFFDVRFAGEPRMRCELFARHVQELRERSAEADVDGNGQIAWYCLETVNVARRVELDPVDLKTWLAHQDDSNWRTWFRLKDDVPDHAKRFAVPPSVKLSGGRHSTALFDRVSEALYGEDMSIMRGLTEEITRRAKAMDAFLAERAGSENLRRAKFRRFMRS